MFAGQLQRAEPAPARAAGGTPASIDEASLGHGGLLDGRRHTVFSSSISIATIVAFTTLQARLFFPVGSLLGVGLDIQTSLALFDRIFEYLDTPVDIAERENPVEVAEAGDVVYDRVWFRYEAGNSVDGAPDEDAWTLQDVSFAVPAGSDRARRRDRRREDDARLPRGAARPTRPGASRVSIGGVDVRDLSFAALASLVGTVPQETYLFHASVRET